MDFPALIRLPAGGGPWVLSRLTEILSAWERESGPAREHLRAGTRRAARLSPLPRSLGRKARGCNTGDGLFMPWHVIFWLRLVGSGRREMSDERMTSSSGSGCASIYRL